MTKRHENKSMAEAVENESATEASVVARRRFVKRAALALPAIATLRGGGPAAALSDPLRCNANPPAEFSPQHYQDQDGNFWYVIPENQMNEGTLTKVAAGNSPVTISCYISLDPTNTGI